MAHMEAAKAILKPQIVEGARVKLAIGAHDVMAVGDCALGKSDLSVCHGVCRSIHYDIFSHG